MFNLSSDYIFIKLTDITGLTILIRTDSIIRIEQTNCISESNGVNCKVVYTDGTSDYVQESIDNIIELLTQMNRKRQLNE